MTARCRWTARSRTRTPEGRRATTTVALEREETERAAPAGSGRLPHADQRRPAHRAGAGAPRWTGREAHRIDLEGHGREDWIGDLDVSRTVGWFTTLYPGRARSRRRAEDEGRRAQARQGTASRRAGPRPQLRRSPLRVAARPSRQLATSPAELLFNYLGQFDQVVAGSELFRFATEPTGRLARPGQRRTHRFEVVALVRDGRFEARWIYGAERDRPEVVERLADDFIRALRR